MIHDKLYEEDGAKIYLIEFGDRSMIVHYFISENPGNGIRLLRRVLGEYHPDCNMYAVLEPESKERGVSSLSRLVKKVRGVEDCALGEVVAAYRAAKITFMHTDGAVAVRRIVHA